ncbi:MAG: protein kinase [Bryobacteraceae bacterium]
MVGQALRHYQIEGKLGSGGMGIVYRAVDTRLERPVAIKLLSSSALSNPERRRRFVQEAKTASALNHPNIVTIYEIDTGEFEGDRVDFIAMELVQGQTLDKLIASRGLRVRDALEYAIQISGALAAAHAAGIIHRDLKPSNIMVTEEGLVKILDFGLAKFEEPAADAYAATETINLDMTQDGTILGTVSYMSPEQAEGKKVDVRSDIFSFGSVLYEMVTGKRAFGGDSKVSALSAILLKEPEPLATLVAGVPLEFDKIVARCLKKDPQRRWHTMADVRVAMQDLLEELETGKARTAARPRAALWSKPWLKPALAGLLLGLVPAAYFGYSLSRTEPVAYQRLTFRRGDILSASYAPGGAVVYTARWDYDEPRLFSTQPGSREARDLGLNAGRIASVSSKGEMAVIVNSRAWNLASGTLVRVPFSGGAPREIMNDVVAADWSADGESLAVVREVGSRYKIEFPIGTVIVEKEGRAPPFIRVSPRGELAYPDSDREVGDFAITLATASGTKVLSRGWRATGNLDFAPDGKSVWFTGARAGDDAAIWSADFNGHERVVAQTGGWPIIHDVGADGSILMSVVNSQVGIRFRAADAAEDRDMAWLDSSFLYDLSADAKTMLFVELAHGQGRNSALYLRKTDGSPAVLLGYGNRPSLSPDGKWVVSIRRDGAEPQLSLQPTGAGEQRVLPTPGIRCEQAEWFPDSARILFTGTEGGQMRSWAIPLEGGKPEPVTAAGGRAMRVSPDGATMIVVEKNHYSLAPVSGTGGKPIEGMAPGDSVLRWSADGQSLLIRNLKTDNPNLRIYRLTPATGKRDLLHELKPNEPGAVFYGQTSISADGKSYATSFQRDISSLYRMTGVWH